MPNTNNASRHRSVAAGLVIALAVAIGSAGYEVQPGDTLAKIATEQGSTVAELVDLNGLSNPDMIRVGQVLTLPSESGPVSHTVAPGETLAGIAGTYGTSIADIVAANSLGNPDLLRIGQILTIPGPQGGTAPTTDSPTPSTTAHIVSAGETLASIAGRYGTTVEAIASANGITNPSQIFVGTQLTIGGASPATVADEPTGSAVHVVRAGETLASIALSFDTTVEALVSSNGLTDANLIRIGQELEVPSAGWVCPVAGARYFNDWGFPRSGGRFHQGNDLFAPAGTEVRAPVSGFVELKSGVIGGLQFWLTGDDGNTYIGTHMDKFAQAGEVSAGTVVGYVGTTGNAIGSEPHLHFEILVDGSPVNPYPVLQRSGC